MVKKFFNLSQKLKKNKYDLKILSVLNISYVMIFIVYHNKTLFLNISNILKNKKFLMIYSLSLLETAIG